MFIYLSLVSLRDARRLITGMSAVMLVPPRSHLRSWEFTALMNNRAPIDPG